MRTDHENAIAWFQHTSSVVAALLDWFKRHTEDERQTLIDGWTKLFRGIPVDDLKRAVDEMIERDEVPKPSEIGLACVRIARRRRGALARRPVLGPNGEATVSCRSCEDGGLIQVVDPRDFARAMRGEQGPVHRSAAKCGECRRGRVIGGHARPITRDDVRWREFREAAAQSPKRTGLEVLRDLLYDRHGELAVGEAVVGRFTEFDG